MCIIIVIVVFAEYQVMSMNISFDDSPGADIQLIVDVSYIYIN